MAFDILRGIDHVQQQGDTGRARYADKLLGQAVIAPPEQRQSALAKLAGTDGRMAMVAENQFVQRDEDRQKRQADILTRRAKVAASMPPEALPQLWPSLRASIAQEDPELGAQLPEAWDESFRGVIQQFAGVEKQGNLTPSVSSVEDAYRRGIISKDEYDKGMRIALDLAPGASAPRITWVDKYDPATGTTYKVPMQSSGVDYTGGAPSLTYGSQPQPNQALPSDPQPASVNGDPKADSIVQAMNAMIRAGVPPEQAEAFGQQAMRAAGLQPQTAPADAGAMIPTSGGGGGPAPSGAPMAPPARQQTMADIPINDYGGGAIQSGPSNADVVAQKEREAAATARGGIEGRRDMGPDFEQEKAFRTEYRSAVGPSQDVVQQYERVEGASKNPSAAGDLSMIFAFMKMLDPGSVVREGEFANAQNAAGVPDQLVNLYNRTISGQRLNPAQRADFLKQAATLRDQAQLRIDQATEYYTEIAPEYNIDPRRIIRGDGKKSDAPAAPSIDAIVDRWADK